MVVAATTAAPTTTVSPTTTTRATPVDPLTKPCDVFSADDLKTLYPDLPAGQSQVSQQPLGAECVFGTPTRGLAYMLEKPTGDLSATLAQTAPSQGYAKVQTTAGDLYINAASTRLLFVAKGVYVHFQVSAGAPKDAVVSLATKLAAAINATR